MVLFPEIKYPKFNLGIVVPPYKPYDVLSFLCWFSFYKNMPKVNPIIFVSGNSQTDMVPWARKIGIPVFYVHSCFNPKILTRINIWDRSCAIVISNVFCMKKFKFTENIRNKYVLINSTVHNTDSISYGNIEENKCYNFAHWNIENNFQEVRDRVVNSNSIFLGDKSLNQIKLESFWNDAKNIRTLLDKEAPP